ncbi:MAG: glycosyltransferase family 4 protein [Patescibacteria group bacterium]
MKVLMLSTDENIFKEGSEVSSRILDYGKLVEELHVVVKSSQKISKIVGNVFLYSTNSFGLFYFKKAINISKKIVSQSGRWLITAQDPFETGLVGYLVKRKFNLTLQIQIHTDFLSSYFKKESIKNKIRVFIAKKIIKKADGIRVVSERIKISIIVNCKLKIENSAIAVLPIFIDTQKIKNSPISTDLHKKYPNKFIILMASRLTKEKNIGLAIKAMFEVVKTNSRALLLIVGHGPEFNNLKLQVTSYKLQDFVVFEDWSNDLSSYYKTADLFLLTSNYEGYGMTIIEASAAGLPVVMTDVGVSAGMVSAVGDYKEISRNIVNLIENPKNKESVLKNQESLLNTYKTKEDYLDQLKALWSSCLFS